VLTGLKLILRNVNFAAHLPEFFRHLPHALLGRELRAVPAVRRRAGACRIVERRRVVAHVLGDLDRVKITERKACVVEAGVKILDSAKGSFGAPYLFTKIWPALARFATSPERVDVNT
jgi:hypothetical protein